MKITYGRSESITSEDDGFCLRDFESGPLTDSDPNYLATLCGKDYYRNHDGWEYIWPIDFEIFVDKKSVGVFKVELEWDPNFSASKKEGI